MDYKEKSIMTDLLVQNQALRNAANGFKARCEELEARNKRLEEALENANAACAKWEGLYGAELEKKPAWISVRDILPEKGVCVLVRAKTKFAAGESICIDRLENGEKRPVWFYTHGWYEVTHWMPLPEPPKEE